MLLDLGLDPNHANNEGRTALMGAALKGRNDVIQLLVDRGAKLDTRDGQPRHRHRLGRGGPHVAGDRLRRRSRARRRAVRDRVSRNGSAHSQADDGAGPAGSAGKQEHPVGVCRVPLSVDRNA